MKLIGELAVSAAEVNGAKSIDVQKAVGDCLPRGAALLNAA